MVLFPVVSMNALYLNLKLPCERRMASRELPVLFPVKCEMANYFLVKRNCLIVVRKREFCI